MARVGAILCLPASFAQIQQYSLAIESAALLVYFRQPRFMDNFYIYSCVLIILLVILYPFFAKYIAGGVCTSKAKMDGKTVIVTGANTGIGKETVLDLAKRGARVIMACRDLTRGEVALKEIVEKTGSTKIVLKQLDLASLKSIREFAEDIKKTEASLHVLINNAGVFTRSELTKTKDGFEMTMGVNHLGHFLLTNLLIDLLKKSSPARIVVVSSRAHFFTRSMKLDNLNGEISFKRFNAYCQSKLANVLFTRELTRRLEGTGVIANCLHPGSINNTELTRNLSQIKKYVFHTLLNIFLKTSEQGAQTTIHLAVSEEVEGVSGLYFADCKPEEPCKSAQDHGIAKKLWELSTDLVGLEKTI